MATTQSITAHKDQLRQAMDAYWGTPRTADPTGQDRQTIAYSLLAHAAAMTRLTGKREFVEALEDLPPEDCKQLVSDACGHTEATVLRDDANALFAKGLLNDNDLEKFDHILVRTETLRCVLDIATRLADFSDDPDVSVLVGEKLFGLDKLIGYLYSRPDVLSRRWRVLQNSNGTVPAWLIRAKEHGDLLAKLLTKLLTPNRQSVICFHGTIDLNAKHDACSGQPLSGRLCSPDASLELEVLGGPKEGSLSLELSSQRSPLANALVGYILAPGIGGEPVVGLAVLAPDESTDWFVGNAIIGPDDVRRLGRTCNGVTAGPVALEQLNEEGYRTS
jgi:hypothetical protein